MAFTHPTGRNPHTVALICSGHTKVDYFNALTQYNPAIPRVNEVWNLNKSLRYALGDFAFVLDDLVGEANISERYIQDVVNASCHYPIMTSTYDRAAQDIANKYAGDKAPMISEYPIHAIRDWLGQSFADDYAVRLQRDQPFTTEEERRFGNDLLYMRNSVPMILAYALFIGVKTLYLFGADYSHPVSGTRLEADQPNAEFWVGFCRGRGMQIVVSSSSTLLRSNEKFELYGYGARQPKL